MIDLRRRGFLFGAIAGVVVPAPKTIFIMPRLIVPPGAEGLQYMIKLIEELDAAAVPDPQFIVVSKRWAKLFLDLDLSNAERTVQSSS